ncbi:hypothetical protein H257_14188 [Aphanomyces astaci]|uniref:Uncharacterized protein n=1 Tax=Aphanomyces astaci TaxID=112090 RepID=W4FTY0_APHAT|nr:hypothetical protein, variant 1 [Aphanomyces astaci]XP_009840243.1 hypothetical protein, variant 2 [Aphanomyces astaci]XP_009840244.1 hypothetical protein H257_14188 [Aphanomyces astaci]ETV70283.1 hypothetical protein H257_14188 [Aphanomyces astaci]ETV70284.1 hypothetical protein, variant 1 [Aphanomyces astaci]ETV70285.1 hypothetical protein, variant 2 [Aphanomyces astaci]|eukprot:XP_009840242.1 hypothetical protein, variant 1 [Aphanomyces astaci]
MANRLLNLGQVRDERLVARDLEPPESVGVVERVEVDGCVALDDVVAVVQVLVGSNQRSVHRVRVRVAVASVVKVNWHFDHDVGPLDKVLVRQHTRVPDVGPVPDQVKVGRAGNVPLG